MTAAAILTTQIGVTAACAGMGVPRASYYRDRQARAPLHTVRRPRRSPLALSELEREEVLVLRPSLPRVRQPLTSRHSSVHFQERDRNYRETRLA